jgi:hypothetical protein
MKPTWLVVVPALLWGACAAPALRVGAAAAGIEADDSMVIGGSIGPGRAKGQEGRLRAVAVVVEQPGAPPLAVVACDVLMAERDLLDEAAARIEREVGIPADHVLINTTHTHHAPSTVTVHGYAREETFCRRLVDAIVRAVAEAHAGRRDARAFYRLGHESSVGQNSRLLLSDDTIYWIGDFSDAVRPTGPFDPELPVLSFRGADGTLRALLFNHSTHTIGVGTGSARSPSFYGIAAQELEAELGAPVSFLEGASGSTHNLTLKFPEMVLRIKAAVREALDASEPIRAAPVASIKREFSVRIRRFDEAVEDEKVARYCTKRAPQSANTIIDVFRKSRARLAPLQGEERKTWLQVARIGDVAIAAVPAEFFTKLGLEIKRRSPFRHTIVAELANDWIGYLPDRRGFELGGYQTWMGLHSFTELGTGEAVVEEIVRMLRELHRLN